MARTIHNNGKVVICLVLNSASYIRGIYYSSIILEASSAKASLTFGVIVMMPESQSNFVHWQNLEYEAWYEITGRKTKIVPGSFHTRTNPQYETENSTVVETQFYGVDRTHTG